MQSLRRKAELTHLTSLRFPAAAAVVGYHLSHEATRGSVAFRNVMFLGPCGVTFFFVLSGFVLAFSYPSVASKVDFYGKRLSRIYPLHLLTLLAALPLAHASRPLLFAQIGLSVPLLQAWAPADKIAFGLNGVSWSLSCELFFYALFPYLRTVGVSPLLQRRSGLMIMLATAASLATAAVELTILHGSKANYVLFAAPPFRLLQFLLGVILGSQVRAGEVPRWLLSFRPPAIVVLCALALTGTVLGANCPGLRAQLFYSIDCLMAPLFAVIIAGSAVRELAGAQTRVLGSAACQLLGRSSFALYLIHELLLRYAATFSALQKAEWSVTALALGALAVGLSVPTYLLVEAPLERRLRGLLARRIRAPAGPLTSSSKAF